MDAKSNALIEVDKAKEKTKKLLTRISKHPQPAKKLQSKVSEASQSLRGLVTNAYHSTCEIESLSHIKRTLAHEIATQRGRITSVIELLKANTLLESSAIKTPLVEFAPLDETFAGLVDATFLPVEEQRFVLGSSVTNVTLDGLARIVGSPTIAIEDIVESVFSPDSNIRTCHPGGWERQEDHAAFVLPPLSIKDANALQKELERRDSKARNAVFIGNTARAGCNVVRFGFIHPEKLEEIFSPMASTAYQRSLNTTTGMLSSEKAFETALSTPKASPLVQPPNNPSKSNSSEPNDDLTSLEHLNPTSWTVTVASPDLPPDLTAMYEQPKDHPASE